MPVRAKINCRNTRGFDGEMVRNVFVLIGSLTKLSEDACHQVRDATAQGRTDRQSLSTMWEGLDQ